MAIWISEAKDDLANDLEQVLCELNGGKLVSFLSLRQMSKRDLNGLTLLLEEIRDNMPRRK